MISIIPVIVGLLLSVGHALTASYLIAFTNMEPWTPALLVSLAFFWLHFASKMVP